MNAVLRAWIWVILAFFAVNGQTARAQAAAAFNYTVEEAPAWVVPAAEQPVALPESGGMHYRVIDDQVRIDDKSMWKYTHVVRVVDDAGGLSTASQIELEFDPSYQTLALHHVDVVRGGQRLNRLDRTKFQLLQRETQLERRMYDGRATLSIVLDDVRAGDQVDFAYSIRGANPVFGGRFVHTEWMTSPRGPVALYQMRLLASPERQIQVRTGSPDITTQSRRVGDMRETVFRREAVPPMHVDAGAPYSVSLAHQVQFSEFSDWADVARWGEGLFVREGGGKLVERKAAEIRQHSSNREEQLLAALRFVQRDVRYFGTEIGVNTHQPAPPDKVIEQRFGDCKDKVGLLVALLHRLDIEARPVLVSSMLRGQVDRMLPSPLAFNHAIARVELGGQAYWLDATRAHQGGPLAARQAQGFGRGLVLAPATRALAELPSPYDSEHMVVDDTIRIDRFAAEPLLESRITYRGELADDYRELLATRGSKDLANDLASAYMKVYPKLRSRAPLRVEDATDDDALTLVQQFSIGDFWRFPEQRLLVADIAYWSVMDALAYPKSERRRDPLAFSHPGRYRHTVTLQFPEDVYPESVSDRFEDGDATVWLKTSIVGDARRTVYNAELRIGADEVAPQDWSAYTAKLAKLWPRLSLSAGAPALPLDRIDAVNRELRATEYAIRSKRVQLATDDQVQAMYKLVSLSARLDAGRLPPALEAQALTARGVQYGRLGRHSEASRDLARALLLAPQADETANAAAFNALMTSDFDRALDLAARVLQRNPRDAEALGSRALAHYLQGDLASAEADFSELLKQAPSIRRGYPMVWLSLTMRQAGRDPAVLATRYPVSQWPTEWPRPLVDLGLGRAGADAVLQAARAQKQSTQALCEAYFYIAEKYRAEGDLARAAEYWQKSLSLGVVGYLEHGAARLRVNGLGKS